MKKRIYGWDNSLVPARYLNKLSIPIRNQADYDRMKEKEFGMTKEQYQIKNNIWVAPKNQFIQWAKTAKKVKTKN
jgi:hypothetical protein